MSVCRCLAVPRPRPCAYGVISDGCVRILCGHTAAVACLTILTDTFLVSAGEDGTLMWWKSTSSSCLHKINGIKLNGIPTDVTCLLPFSSADSLFAVGASTGTLIYVEDWVVLGRTQLHAGLSCLALTPDGKRVSACRDDRGTLTLWGPRGNIVFTTTHQSSAHSVNKLISMCKCVGTTLEEG